MTSPDVTVGFSEAQALEVAARPEERFFRAASGLKSAQILVV